MTDLQIAQGITPQPIAAVAEKLAIPADQLEHYGLAKAKLPLSLIDPVAVQRNHLVLVTAITPTPAGEGKTTTSIGLHDALCQLGYRSVVVLREPSLGPVFGIKGGAAGGGWSQVIPMEDINLHFTGDFNAIEKANNLLAALIDNDLQRKNGNLDINPRSVVWKRCMDMNDRALRNVIVGLGGQAGGVPRETGFNITAASEIMAILCLSENFADLQERCGRIYVADNKERKPIYARDLQAEGAMAALLKEAIKPNLVQTLEGNPAILHGGPFANIAQGTNSVLATKMGLSTADFTITEAGFGSDLGAEKFLNIKCRSAGLSPRAVVLVATIRALKYHGGKALTELHQPDVHALRAGLPNLERHLKSLRSFGLPVVVSINAFSSDTEAEKQLLLSHCAHLGVPAALSTGWADGGRGCTALAEQVVAAVGDSKSAFSPTYDLTDSVRTKLEKVCRTIYGAEHVILANKASAQLRRFEQLGYGELPICIAKTQKSLSDDEKLLGRPEHFDIHIREFEIATGAGFIIPIAGNILRMPGLPAHPAAERIGINADGQISGLF